MAHTAPRNTNDSPLAQMRKARGLTQAQLAQAIGVYAKDISRWETGERTPRPKFLKLMAQALDCSIDDIV